MREETSAEWSLASLNALLPLARTIVNHAGAKYSITNQCKMKQSYGKYDYISKKLTLSYYLHNIVLDLYELVPHFPLEKFATEKPGSYHLAHTSYIL